MVLLVLSLASRAGWAAETVLLLEGELAEDGYDHAFLPFTVPEGTAEIEVRHDDLSEANVLDWGLDGPEGFRGWGGGNAEPAVVGERAASRSYLAGPILPGEWRVVVGRAQISEPPARYRVEIVLRDAPTLPDQPERRPYAEAAPLEEGARWYAGDLHVHSRESGDASPSIAEVVAAARARGLDFIALSEHNTTAQLDWIGAAQDASPDVLILPSVEYTTYGGHANATGATAWVDHRVGQPGVTAASAFAAFAAQGAFVGVNHPALDLGGLCIGCAWEHGWEGAAGIEIITGGWEPVGRLFFPQAVAIWEEREAAGQRLVPVGGSDDHRAGTGTGPTDSPLGSPTTLIYAESLSASALLDALHAGRTVVKLQGPGDPMLELWPADDGTGEWEITATGAPVDGTATVALIADGAERAVWTIDADPFTLRAAAPGDRVRAELRLDGEPRTLTAYHDAQEIPIPPEEGCGCQGGAALLALLPLALRRRSIRLSA